MNKLKSKIILMLSNTGSIKAVLKDIPYNDLVDIEKKFTTAMTEVKQERKQTEERQRIEKITSYKKQIINDGLDINELVISCRSKK